MHDTDKLMKLLFTNPFVFADIFNYWLYDGENRIRPENLRETSGDLISLTEKYKELEDKFLQSFGNAASAKSSSKEKPPEAETIERIRDTLMQFVCMEDGESLYVLLGIEGQTYVDYSMAARALIYDALQINKQLDTIRTEHIMKNETGSSHGEYLYRYFKTDHLTPVITVVVYLGKDEWDGPLSLRDMYRIKDPLLLRESLDYKMKLIAPRNMSDEDIEKFQTNMREILLYLRSAKDKKQLYKLAEENKFRDMEPVAAHLLNAITKSNLNLTTTTKEGKIQMCEAIKGIREDGIQEGIRLMQSRSQQIYDEGRTEGQAQTQREGTIRLAAQGISISVIAEAFNVPEPTIQSRLSEAAQPQE